MKRRYARLRNFILAAALLTIGANAYADDIAKTNSDIQALQNDRNNIVLSLGIKEESGTYPHATCYYDDLEDHFEHTFMQMDHQI